MNTDNSMKRNPKRSSRLAGKVSITFLISLIIAGLAGNLYASRSGRQRHTMEERETIHSEHVARIIERLDLTEDQKTRILPLLEEGMGMRMGERFERRDGYRLSGRSAHRKVRMDFHRHEARRHELMALRHHRQMSDRCCQDHSIDRNRGAARRPDRSYHNGKVCDSGKNLRFRDDRGVRGGNHGHIARIEEILTKEQIERFHEIRMELRKELFDNEESEDR
ncbi:MAG: hypothetical protein JW814_08065 [Candidatus Krumholzibacteriota bacterium]|nr:hypothetical protein [Candidatus Krumholzibacteriota bacterium]